MPFNGYVDFPLDLIEEAPAPEPEPQAEPEPLSLPDIPVMEEGYYDDPADYYDDPPDHRDEPPPPATGTPSIMANLEHGPLPLLRQASADIPGEAAPLPEALKVAKPKKKKSRPQPAPVAVEPPPPPPPEPDHDEPAFVRRSREREASGRTRRLALAAGSAVLAIALLVQATTTFRNVLVARFPALKTPIGATCAVFGCTIELPAEIDSLSIETGELQTLGGNHFVLTTLLRNQSSLIQTWPNIELALTDPNDKILLRRIIAPADYLPKGTLVSKGFAARSEQAVKLEFEVSQIKASGYRIAMFYP